MNTGDKYCDFAAVALLVYEILITFDREVEHVWKRKCSAASLFFVLNRYVVLGSCVVQLIMGVDDSGLSQIGCGVLLRLYQTLNVLPYIVWALFSALRAYAISDCRRNVSGIILSLSLVPVALYLYRDVYEYAKIQPENMGCTTVKEYSVALDTRCMFTVVCRTCLILSDILVLYVTWAKTYGILRLAREYNVNTSFSLTTILLRDGSIYFTIWTIINSLQIAGTYAQALRYVTAFTDATTSILVSRFILNLREAVAGRKPTWSEPLFDESWYPASRSSVLCNLLRSFGAPLDHTFSTAEEMELDNSSGPDNDGKLVELESRVNA